MLTLEKYGGRTRRPPFALPSPKGAPNLPSAGAAGVSPVRPPIPVTSVSVPITPAAAIGEGVAGRGAPTRQPMFIEDYRKWEGRSPQYEDAPLRSVLEVPMLYSGELIGVLTVDEMGDAERKFTQEDADLLSLFASQAAGAVTGRVAPILARGPETEGAPQTQQPISIPLQPGRPPAAARTPQAAAVIHDDFERGFIAAEVRAYDDYGACGGEQGAKQAGKMRLEGREYVVADGDVILFRFNV